MDTKKAKKIVKDAYGRMARESGCGCCNPVSDRREFARSIGYSEAELEVIPDEANLALSCGNPTALASLKEGDIVLDLGSGAGFDCFLALSKVGKTGRVIGVDMTPEMIERARENASKIGTQNVEFRLGEIENLPVADNSIDVVISNCVINLSVDKEKVFKEIYRVLKPGGRIAISDVALLKGLPSHIKKSVEAYVGCVAGAVPIDEYEKILKMAGLKNTRVTIKGTSSCCDQDTSDPVGKSISESLKAGNSLKEYVVNVYVEGMKGF